jgi:inward rectifier potassium channel
MRQVPLDPGLSQTYYGEVRRIINKDGSFNIRHAGSRLRNLHVYQYLICISWLRFILIVLTGFIVVNALFAGLYLLAGIENLHGADGGSSLNSFLSAFFFSSETFTTTGYGNIAPHGFFPNLLAALEAALGLMGFALAAALLYGRFSRPHAKLLYSEWAVIAPYQGGKALMFRVVNERTNLIMELEARVLLMTVEMSDSGQKRVYRTLELERSAVDFLPLTWTIVHPIDAQSPLYNADHNTLSPVQAEIMVQIRGFDDTFNQWVHSRYSYRYDEIIWGARFLPAFRVDEKGETVLDVDQVHRIEAVKLPQERDEGGKMKDEGRVELTNGK